MNISEVKVALSGSDLLSIINDFVKVDGLEISEIKIEEEIKIYGSFKKGISVDFIAGIKLTSLNNDEIYGEISSFKLLKLGMISIIRKLAMKYAIKAFEDKGMYYKDGKIVINIKKLLKDIPYINIDIEDIHIKQGLLNVGAKNINISLEGTLVKEFEEEEVIEEEEIKVEEIKKVKDNYSNGREYLEKKLSPKVKTFSDYLFIIPDMAALIYRLLKDKRVPIKTKIVISGAIAYIAFPTDIIPDNIPFIGRIDELAVSFFALDRIVTDVPVNIILENWEGKNDIILVIKSLIEYVINFTGAKNVEKIYKVVDEIVSL
ncbi:DUF1232 domain-containing protein [Clostridium carnis]